MSADALIAKIEVKQQVRVGQLVVPSDGNRTWAMRLDASATQSGQQSGPQRWLKTLYVDPYIGEIRGDGGHPTDAFFMTMLRLHRFLLLPTDIGLPIVGIVTVVFGVLLLTGLVLWLPRTIKAWAQWKNWRMGLTVWLAKG